jgi:galactokinase/mevalonate kinase-like predicted kinase
MFVEASVPGRVNLFGNPLDIYGGLVISSSIAARATVSARSAKGLRITFADREADIRSANDLRSRGDPFDFLRALLQSLGVVPDCHIGVSTDIPVRSGLAGSAALMLAASACLLNFLGKPATAADILQTAHEAEVDYLKNFCGWNDFYACFLGGVHQLDYRKPIDAVPEVSSLALPEADVSFAVALTGDMHRSGDVNRSLWERWNAGDATVRAEYEGLARLGPSARSAFEGGDWPSFGRLMQQNFKCQYRLAAANAAENGLVHEATARGALGAKLCGAGHCGSIVVLARNDDHDRIRSGLEALGVEQYFKVVPAEGLIVRRS